MENKREQSEFECAICAGDTNFYENIKEIIKRVGWMVIAVGTEDDGIIPFAYTIGVSETFNHPEFFISGLDMLTSQSILNAIVLKIKTHEEKIKSGDLLDEIIDGGYQMKVIQMDTDTYKDRIIQAVEYYKKNLSFLQVVWPDTEGEFISKTEDAQEYCGIKLH